jgi:hypothetical protein
MAIAESSKEVGYGEEAVLVSPPNLSHSNSANSFRNEKLGHNFFLGTFVSTHFNEFGINIKFLVF